MNSVIARERELYADVFRSVEKYSDFSPGEHYAKLFVEMGQTTMFGSVLDAGCGTGKGAMALQALGFKVSMCDLTREGLVPQAQAMPFTEVCLWSNLKRHVGFVDWVFCCDVLEHIPTAFTMLVVARLLEVARRGVFLTISTVADQFGVFVGRPLHQTVEPFVWWRDQLNAVGHVREARDLLNCGVYLVES